MMQKSILAGGVLVATLAFLPRTGQAQCNVDAASAGRGSCSVNANATVNQVLKLTTVQSAIDLGAAIDIPQFDSTAAFLGTSPYAYATGTFASSAAFAACSGKATCLPSATRFAVGGPTDTIYVKANRAYQLSVGAVTDHFKFEATQLNGSTPICPSGVTGANCSTSTYSDGTAGKTIADLLLSTTTDADASYAALTQSTWTLLSSATAGTSGNSIASTSGGTFAAYPLFVRTKWTLSQDVPGNYQLVLRYTLIGQ